jgi:type 1 glutamine amidotransferase
LAAAIGAFAQSASVRLEDWALFRSAAPAVLGWKIAVRAGAFPGSTFSEAAAKVDALGFAMIAGDGTQNVSREIPKKLGPGLAPGEIQAVRDRLRALNLRMPAYFTAAAAADEGSLRKLFEFAKALGVETVVLTSRPAGAAIDPLAGEYGIRVARAEGDEAVVTLARAGVSGLAARLRELYDRQAKPALITVDPASAEELEKALHPIMAEGVRQIASAAAIRGPERLPEEERRKVEAALPKRAPVKPKKARRLLVMDLNVAYGGHRSIPHANLALETMGKQTGAYEAVFSNDLENLKRPNIQRFDAVYLNNTVGMIFVEPEVREGLARFVREGGGLAGHHGVSHASMDWAEFGEMIGTKWGVHREATEQATIRIDDPKHPLTAAFAGKAFVHQDEFFRFPMGPYSREKLRVLLSIDVEKTDMNQGRPCPKPCSRPDNDYAVSWIRSYGKGRVFFCILGHNPTLYMTPALAEYFLAGIQFILGDLDADTTPSAKLGRGAS